MSTISSTKRSSLASVSSLDEVTKTKSSSNRPVSSIELTNSNFNSKFVRIHMGENDPEIQPIRNNHARLRLRSFSFIFVRFLALSLCVFD